MSHFQHVPVKISATEENIKAVKRIFDTILSRRPEEDLSIINKQVVINNYSEAVFLYYGLNTKVTPIGFNIDTTNNIMLVYDQELGHIRDKDGRSDYINSLINEVVAMFSQFRRDESRRLLETSIQYIRQSGANVSVIEH